MTDIIQKDAEGSDVLRQTADAVAEDEFGTDELNEIITKMQEALHATDDGVAIAAPQVGVSKRIFLVRDAVLKDRGDLGTKDKVFINPTITNTSQETVDINEGCLSVRDTYGEVTRHQQATVRAQDQSGEQFEVGGSGLLAQIFQHETEHLDGTLFVDKARNLREIDPETRRKNAGLKDA
jgi:peptide deformylase